MNATLENPSNLNLVLDVPVSLTIELGGCQLPMREVLQLNVGSVVQLDKAADAPSANKDGDKAAETKTETKTDVKTEAKADTKSETKSDSTPTAPTTGSGSTSSA